MEVLEVQKADIDIELSRLRIANSIQLTEQEVRAWLKKFCTSDPMDVEFQKCIIDVFINVIYLYDDRVIVFYNIRGGKQVSFFNLASSELIEEESGSNLNDLLRPKPVSNRDGFYFIQSILSLDPPSAYR